MGSNPNISNDANRYRPVWHTRETSQYLAAAAIVSRRFITGQDVQALPEGAILDVPKDAIITDIAREWIDKKRIRIVTPETNPSVQPEKARVAVGSDHAGFEMKEAVKTLLSGEGISFIDFGAYSTDSVDYPDFAHAVAVAVAVGRAEIGIMVDGAGIGSAIVANKVPGIRAAPCQDEVTARNSREHNDANVLTLGSRLITTEAMNAIVHTFLDCRMSEPRHRNRVRKVVKIERKYSRPV